MLALFLTTGLTWAVPAVVVLAILYLVYIYFFTHRHLIDIPGPFPAKFTGAWMAWETLNDHIIQDVHQAHEKYGKFVRLQPNHVSINDDAAIPLIYGHGSKLLKSTFYDSFVVKGRNIFTSRSRPEHARKRRFLSHAFSAQSLHQFEPYIATHLQTLLRQLDKQITAHTSSTPAGVVPNSFNILPWFNYETFDIISDLAFGRSLNMLSRGCDLAEMKLSPEGPTEFYPAIEPIAVRSTIAIPIGMFPPLRYLDKIPVSTFASRSRIAGQKLAGLALACVTQRLGGPDLSDRKDILYRMMEAKGEKGESLTTSEITSEAIALLVAGSDTTAHSLSVFTHYLARNPDIQSKLQREIDAAVPDGVDVPTLAMVQPLHYLEACMKETLRLHSLIGLGLPREIPVGAEGLDVSGRFFPPGTIVSVPLYSVHHSAEIWGHDVEQYRPERWETATPRQKAAYNPFQIGPRGCIGRSLAEVELKLTMASLLKRYHLKPGQGLIEFHEALSRKPDHLNVVLERR